jgi:uncharacterized protein YhfF
MHINLPRDRFGDSDEMVDAQFANDEGEDGRSLESWRHEHQVFFERNGGFKPDMLLVCERFKVIRTF